MGCSHHFPGHFFSSKLTVSGACWHPICQQSLGRQTTLGFHFKSPGKGAKPGLLEKPNSQSICQILCIISLDPLGSSLYLPGITFPWGTPRRWQPTPVFFAWRIPGMGEPGGLPSMGSQRVGHDWSDLAAAAAVCICGEGNGTPLQYSCLENPMDGGVW